MSTIVRRRGTAATIAAAFLLLMAQSASAQFPFGPPRPQGPARAVAPIDLTGQWVSIVTEDWRFRMLTPPKNDYPGLPLNAAARAVADQWDPERDAADGNACKSYGVGAIMRVPGRLRISWDDDSTLRIETDAGMQTRFLDFSDAPQSPGERSWQGISKAEWEFHRAGFGQPPANGTLKVVTTGMRAGYLRKNGVPYGENTVVTEYFDLLTQHDGTEWLVVLTIVEDPEYFTSRVITSSNFRREAERSKWDPTPCTAM
ncbi:MAG TPA: hypothetical protein VIC71_15370 [Gammaproteobacteria bacterium]|jgi:hypothetical protein